MARGKFITFEGGEGAGKSTQSRLLADWLAGRGITPVVTREPGGTPLAEGIRSLLLSVDGGRADALTEALLFNAARRDHVKRLIAPSLDHGQWVICDRYIDSTRAYQGAGGQLDGAVLQRLEDWVTAEAKPDLTLILDLPEAEGLRRAAARHQTVRPAEGRDRFEAADLGFHLRLRLMFLRIAQSEPDRCVVVDGQSAPELVAEAVRAAVAERLAV